MNRLKKQRFSKYIAINKDLSELKSINFYDVLNNSLTHNIFIVDTKKRQHHVDECNIIKNEYVKSFKYDENFNFFRITKDNKMYLDINIVLFHYSKIIDVNWFLFMNNLSKHSDIPLYYFVIINI